MEAESDEACNRAYEAKASEIVDTRWDEILEDLADEIATADESSIVGKMLLNLAADMPDPRRLVGSGWLSWQRQDATRLGEWFYKRLAELIDEKVRHCLGRED